MFLSCLNMQGPPPRVHRRVCSPPPPLPLQYRAVVGGHSTEKWDQHLVKEEVYVQIWAEAEKPEGREWVIGEQEDFGSPFASIL